MRRLELDLPTRVLAALWRLQKPFEKMTPADFALYNERQGRTSWISRLFTGPEIPLPEVRDQLVPARGGPVRTRIYTPVRGVPLPVMIYFHGGGFVLGGIESFDHVARAIAKTARMRVISVDYRLAPKHPFPAAVDDAEDVLAWVLEHASELASDQPRIFVGGDSAGGNLAAVLAIHARDGGIPLAGQILVYPATDMSELHPSMERYAHAPVLSAAAAQHFASHYITEERRRDPRCSPMLASDHADLAPALVLTAEYDPIGDQGRLYAERLRQAGVRVRHRDFARAVHGFLSFPRLSRAAGPALDEIASFVA